MLLIYSQICRNIIKYLRYCTSKITHDYEDMPVCSEFMGNTFQAAQLTQYSTTHQGSVEVQFGRHQKNILQK